jgi:hypothetical protein
MRRRPGVILMLAGLAIPTASWAGADEASEPSSARLIYLLPDGFRGWACVDFGVVDAPPLPREGDALVIRPRPGEVIATSDTRPNATPIRESWIESAGSRRPLPDEDRRRWIRFSDALVRDCTFFGTEDEANAAGDPAGAKEPPELAYGVSSEEREALVALYEATDGGHWTHRMGWLGLPGTECSWYGVKCRSVVDGRPTVTQLDLSENNLVGSLPESSGRLTHLERLHLYGNRLSGDLPDALMRRWLAGPLVFSGDLSLLTDVSEISFDSTSTSMLCAHHQVTLRPDGSARLLTKRCRNATRGDRRTFCDMKEGHLRPQQFARLAVLIERNGFFEMKAAHSRNVTDARFETTRVVRNGKPYRVSNYAAAAPFELWVVQTAIEGIASSVEWEKTTTRPKCPWAEDFDLPFRD